MRAGPLSSPRVIDLLNTCFVPIFAVNEDYRDNGPAPKEEKAEYQRIYHEALDARLSAGTVHAYVVDTAGHPIDSLHVADALEVMTCPRLYRSASLGVPAALEELERNAGSQFDAAVVRAMWELVRSGALEVGEQQSPGYLGSSSTNGISREVRSL